MPTEISEQTKCKNAKKCKVIKAVVDFMPEGCGDCPMMQYSRYGEWPCCVALPEEINGIEGNPCDMKYRRSDCPLCIE